jgi:hypothetical protein
MANDPQMTLREVQAVRRHPNIETLDDTDHDRLGDALANAEELRRVLRGSRQLGRGGSFGVVAAGGRRMIRRARRCSQQHVDRSWRRPGERQA